jgi:hypothetical protein
LISSMRRISELVDNWTTDYCLQKKPNKKLC